MYDEAYKSYFADRKEPSAASTLGHYHWRCHNFEAELPLLVWCYIAVSDGITMWPNLAKWVVNRTLRNDTKALKKLPIPLFDAFSIFTYVFIFIWLISNTKIVWHRRIKYILKLKYLLFNFSLKTVQSVICVPICMLPWKHSLISIKYWYSVKILTLEIYGKYFESFHNVRTIRLLFKKWDRSEYFLISLILIQLCSFQKVYKLPFWTSKPIFPKWRNFSFHLCMSLRNHIFSANHSTELCDVSFQV